MKILIMTDEGELLEKVEAKNPTGDIHNRIFLAHNAGEAAREATHDAYLTLHLRELAKRQEVK